MLRNFIRRLENNFLSIMPSINKLLDNQTLIEAELSHLKSEVFEIELLLEQSINEFSNQSTSANILTSILKENKFLEEQIKKTKDELIHLETIRGLKQISVPKKGDQLNSIVQNVNKELSNSSLPTEGTTDKPVVDQEITGNVKKNVSKNKDKPSSKDGGGGESNVIDVSRLDLRVGKIIDINKHPEADSLYVETVDIGSDKPITVVSGLVKHVPIDEMRDRLVVLLCNLKPAKMRGVTSEAMVMCASTPDKVEVLCPPEGCVPGDLIQVEGFNRNPDPVLNPKKKIFEAVAPDLTTDADKRATYKGNPWLVEGKGVVTTKSLTNVNIK